MKYQKSLSRGLLCSISLAILLVIQPEISLAQSNPCAAKAPKGSPNPCAAKNPCGAKNPCAANPCAPGGKGGAAAGKAITVRGEVAKVDAGTKRIVLKREGGQLDLAVGPHAVIRDGAKVKSLKDLKAGEKVMVSYVDTGKERTAWYVYSASASAMANPCGGNPCAAKNPCAANPCAAKAKQATKNPCAAKNPCAPKTTKGR